MAKLSEMQAAWVKEHSSAQVGVAVEQPPPVEEETADTSSSDVEGDLANALALLGDVRDVLSALVAYLDASDGQISPYLSNQIPLVAEEVDDFLDQWEWSEQDEREAARAASRAALSAAFDHLDDADDEEALSRMVIDLQG